MVCYNFDDDAQSEAYYALCKAALTYNPDSGNKFSTYAYRVVQNHFRDLHRHNARPRRGLNYQTISLDESHDDSLWEDFGGTLHDIVGDERVDTESEAIHNVFVHNPVLQRIAPYTIDLYLSGVNQAQYSQMMGVTHQTISQTRIRERQRIMEWMKTGKAPKKWMHSYYKRKWRCLDG